MIKKTNFIQMISNKILQIFFLYRFIIKLNLLKTKIEIRIILFNKSLIE